MSSPSAVPSKPAPASCCSNGTMPLLSCLLAVETLIASGKPYLSPARWILMPLIFLPPSKPRPKQVGAERQERLSMMTALGSAVSPQACRQARIKRLSRRRHSPSRVQRANSVYSVPNGMSHSWPIARHCMPQKHTHQIAMMALRSAAPVNGGFGPERVGRVPSATMAASSASTASTKASTSENASHEAGDVLAGLKAVPICCGSSGCWRWPQTYPDALPSVSPYSPQSSIAVSTGWHAPSANRLSVRLGIATSHTTNEKHLARSVVLTPEGLARSEQLFQELF